MRCVRKKLKKLPDLDVVVTVVGASVSLTAATRVMRFAFSPLQQGDDILIVDDMALGGAIVVGALTTAWFGLKGFFNAMEKI